MINFFRKIRKQLADDNKPWKYMRYAIGEIVLVVIGILIALSINNWNQKQTDRIAELKLLREFKMDIEDTLIQLEDLLQFTRDNIDSCAVTIERFEKGLHHDPSYVNAYSSATSFFSFVPRSLAYENLKSTGIDRITSDSIRFKLITLYGEDLTRIHNIENLLLEKITDFKEAILNDLVSYGTLNRTGGIYQKSAKHIKGFLVLGPRDFRAFRNNYQAINLLKEANNLRIYWNGMLLVYIDSMIALDSLITTELKNASLR